MTISTSEEFFAVLRRSKLLEPEQLAEADSIAGECDDAKSAAKALVNAELITRWQAGQLLAGRGSFFLGKYKLIELLGRGGMGGVFLGRHVTMNRPVALKIVSRQVGKDPASLERFLAEARTIAALDHPNIVQAYSVDNEGDRYYIVMEFIDGLDLQQMVETEGPLDFDTAADYIRQAAEGLQHGHQRNIVHCDIKPSNLLVNRQGVVKIVDMGLSLLTGKEQHQENNHDDGVLGSVDYLAPEQALRTRDFDHRADIYSLGCTLYFLLTGRPPFHEGLLHERLMRHQTQEPERIAKLRGDVPAELVRICRKMMAKNPADRFQSAEEVGLALGAWQHPMQELSRAAPLKQAEALDETAGVGPESDTAATLEDIVAEDATVEEASTEKTEQPGALWRKIVTAVAAVAVVMLLSTTVAYLMQCRQKPVETGGDKIRVALDDESIGDVEEDEETDTEE